MKSQNRDILIGLALVIPITAVSFGIFALILEILYWLVHG